MLVHGHCQQKAVVGTAGTLAALRRVPGLEVKELDSGCCGMAGSFGYERGHYEVSEALANRVLIPAALADPDGPAGRSGLFLPQPGARPGRNRGAAPDRGSGRTTLVIPISGLDHKAARHTASARTQRPLPGAIFIEGTKSSFWDSGLNSVSERADALTSMVEKSAADVKQRIYELASRKPNAGMLV